MVRNPPGRGQKGSAPPPASRLTDDDLYLFNEGSHFRLYEKLGAHVVEGGVSFGVWAPDAEAVSVIGEFNDWNPDALLLRPKGDSGIWEGLLPGGGSGLSYKYHVRSRYRGYRFDKADPFAFETEVPPATASVTCDLTYTWKDEVWMAERRSRNAADSPMAVYEVHLGSWRRTAGGRPLTYREIAPALAEYVVENGFTHVEFLPVMEHPFGGSWGYQTLGYFAPTRRFGPPRDFMSLVDVLHRAGVGVILDWVPSHFPKDGHGLAYFDGTHLFEHEDPRKGLHPDWDSLIFNYGRKEVQSFLISSALFWLDRYHADGLRVDAVASMLYLDYSRDPGDWIPNEYGGRENLEAIDFLRRLNTAVYEAYPDVQTVAEDSTDWPMVSRPIYVGGLGFGMKWDMGWMHDTLSYMSRDPIHRSYHHDRLTFRMLYAFHENFALPLSHDEVVHGKGSLIGKMPGDDWQKFANLRLLFGYMYAQPGKKLLFMGGEIAQWSEWNHESSLEWHLLEFPRHNGMRRWVADLNRLYREEAALHELDFLPSGFEWIDCSDSTQSVISLIRKGRDPDQSVIAVCNFTPEPHTAYRIGAPMEGRWLERLNSDGLDYGGSGLGNLGGVETVPEPCHGYSHSMVITIPPLAAVFFRKADERPGPERPARNDSDEV